VIAPNGFAGGADGRTGDIWINPDSDTAKRLPTRYADYPLQAGDVFCLDTPGGGGYGGPRAPALAPALPAVRGGGVVGAAAGERYGVMIQETAGVLAVDEPGTLERRARMNAKQDKRDE